MVEGTGNKCAKYLLFIFNILFVILGLALIIVGALAQSFVVGHFREAIFVIIIGGVIFIVAFFGCCGAIKENRCMLITFAVFLLVILLLCIVGAIIGFVFRNEAKDKAHDQLYSYIKEYKNESVERETIDFLQKDGECCGINNYTDWGLNEQYNKSESVPDSCCKDDKDGCGQGGLIDPEKINTHGCISYIEELLVKYYVAIGVITVILALTVIMGIILACCLAKAVSKGYNTV